MSDSGQGSAQEEWVRAQAQLIRARAGEIEFGRVERAWRLGFEVAFGTILVVALAAIAIIAVARGDGGLLGPGAAAIGVAGVVLRLIRRSGAGDR